VDTWPGTQNLLIGRRRSAEATLCREADGEGLDGLKGGGGHSAELLDLGAHTRPRGARRGHTQEREVEKTMQETRVGELHRGAFPGRQRLAAVSLGYSERKGRIASRLICVLSAIGPRGRLDSDVWLATPFPL
jgi:hypothetical protein